MSYKKSKPILTALIAILLISLACSIDLGLTDEPDSPTDTPTSPPGVPTDTPEPAADTPTATAPPFLTTFNMSSAGYYASVAFHPDGTKLAATNETGELKMWDLYTGAVLLDTTTTDGMEVGYPSLAFSPNGRFLAATANAYQAAYSESWGAVRCWDLLAGGAPLILIGDNHWGVLDVAFSPDSARLAGSRREGMGGGGSVKVWDPGSGALLLNLSTMDMMTGVDFSPDGSKIIGSTYGEVIKWDAGGSSLGSLSVAGGPIWEVAYTPDGAHIAVRSESFVFVVGEATGTAIYTISEVDTIWDFAISPTGTWIATAVDDSSTVNFYNLSSGAMLGSVTGPAAPVLAVAASPDGVWLATVDANGTVQLWR